MAGHLHPGDLSQLRVEALGKCDDRAVVTGLDAGYPPPEGFVLLIGTCRLQHLGDLVRTGTRGRRDLDLGLVGSDVLQFGQQGLLPGQYLRPLFGPPPLEQCSQVPPFPATWPEGLRAARMEGTSVRGRSRIGYLPARQLPRHRSGGVGIWNRSEEGPGVGVFRIGEDLLRGADLHDPAQIHDRYSVTEVFCRGQVMGDVDVGQVQVPAQVEHQFQDLGAHAHIQHGDRLIGNKQLRAADDRPGDDGTLLLPTGQFGGQFVQELLGRHQAGSLQRLDHPLSFSLLVLDQALDAQRVADGGPQVHRGVEGCVRVLEDHLQAAAQGAQPRLAHRRQVYVAIADLPGCGAYQSQQRSAEGGLPTTGLPHQSDHFSLTQGEVHAVDGFDPLAAAAEQAHQGIGTQVEMHLQVADLHQGLRVTGLRAGNGLRLRRQR
ncbi:MAG TPA: hypothetical protein VK095_01405 [Beutenbergiaceae bacterium]|nr:hypothetical protein [Beutenbergiaceae bacterium]